MINKPGHYVWVVMRTLILAMGGLVGAGLMLILGFGPRSVHSEPKTDRQDT